MKRRICISSDDGSGSSGSMSCWAGKDTKLDTLLEQLIDSVLLMNNKVEGLSNRIYPLEEKVNQENLRGRNERTEFMNEVKAEIAELKKSEEEEQPVFVGSHLVSKLSNLQNLVRDKLPVDDASDSEGWSPLQRNHRNKDLNSWGKCLNVQRPNQVDSWRTCTNQLDVHQQNHGNVDLNSWDKHLNVQRPNQVDSWRTCTNQLDVQQRNHVSMDLNLWDEYLNVQQPNQVDRWSTCTNQLDVQQRNHGSMDLNSWNEYLNVEQPNQVDSGRTCTNQLYVQQQNHRNRDLNLWDKHLNVQQPNVELSSGGWRPWTSHLDVQQPSGLNVQQPSGEDHWSPPDENVTKVNVSVAFSSDSAACGVIARSHLAKFKGCCTELLVLNSQNSPMATEAEAYLAGVRFAIKYKLYNIVIEGDSQHITTILNDANYRVPWYVESEIGLIRKLACNIPIIEFRFIKKSGNVIAQTLASYAMSNLIAESWVSSPPPIITSLLNAESNYLGFLPYSFF
ncbi:hypothetical protein MKW92_053047 [Papaver armeniacum]|nr:hypothetical protein MKW92_053047 [Papaver armeniacum]